MGFELAYEPASSGGLVVHGVGWDRCARLQLGSDGAALLAVDVEPIELPWTSHRSPKWAMDGPALDAWCVSHFTSGRAGLFGVAIRVSGCLDDRSGSVRDATMTWARRWSTWLESGGSTGHLVPLVAGMSVAHLCTAERPTLAALCRFLVARPQLRAHLDEPERCERLARDLSRTQLQDKLSDGGIRGRTVDIEIALRRCGYVHEFGRPIADEPLEAPDSVVAAVRKGLDRLPPAAPGRSASDVDIEGVVRTHYCDVTPWPFAALLD